MKMTMKLGVATISGILLFSSINLAAEAAPSSGSNAMLMRTAAAEPKVMNEGKKLEKAEQDRISKLLEENPDDTYIVYVSNELTKVKGGHEVYTMGNNDPQYDKYENYLKKAASLKEATPQQPTDLPEGYAFVEARIMGPYSTEYAAEIKAEAKKLGKKIYSKKLDWKTSNWTRLEYKNGDDTIILGSGKLDSMDKKKNKQGYTYESAAEMKKQNPKVDAKYLTNSLIWIENDKRFSISTNSGNPMTKEDLIKLAKTMVKK